MNLGTWKGFNFTTAKFKFFFLFFKPSFAWYNITNIFILMVLCDFWKLPA